MQLVSSLASSVASSAVGTSGGASATGSAGSGGSSSGSTTILITQVQFLNMYGRIGGSQGSEGMKAFSDGFGESTLLETIVLRHMAYQ